MVKGKSPLLVGWSSIVAVATVGILIIPVVIPIEIGIWNTVEIRVVSTVGRIPTVGRMPTMVSFQLLTVFVNSVCISHHASMFALRAWYTLIFLRCSTLFSAVRSCLEREVRCNVCVFRLRIGENIVSWIIMSFSTHGDCSL